MRLASAFVALALLSGAPALACDVAVEGLSVHEGTGGAVLDITRFVAGEGQPEGQVFVTHLKAGAMPKDGQEAEAITAQVLPRIRAFYKVEDAALVIDKAWSFTPAEMFSSIHFRSPSAQEAPSYKPELFKAFSGTLTAEGRIFAVNGFVRRTVKSKQLTISAAVTTEATANNGRILAAHYIVHPGLECTAGDGP